MKKKVFGSDAMDVYSVPKEVKTTFLDLGIIICTKVRTGKSGRALFVLNDIRKPVNLGSQVFIPQYEYVNTIFPRGSAGNHYHKVKKEVFTVLHGSILVELVDTRNPKIAEAIWLNAIQEGQETVQRLYIGPYMFFYSNSTLQRIITRPF